MTTMNDSDRRRNLSIQISYRDELLDGVAVAMNSLRAVDGDVSKLSDRDLRQATDAGENVQQWVDGPNATRFPGVRDRLIDGLVSFGFTRELYTALCAELGVRTRPAKGVHTCGKCEGRGRLNWTDLADGVCFACKGTGKIVIK